VEDPRQRRWKIRASEGGRSAPAKVEDPRQRRWRNRARELG